MEDIPFDTLSAVRRLEDNGFSAEKAEAITAVVREGITGGIATKADLAQLEAKMDGRIDRLEAKMDGRIDRFEAKMDGRIDRLEAKMDGRIDRLEADLKWMKLIGGAILAVLILPWLAELLPFYMSSG